MTTIGKFGVVALIIIVALIGWFYWQHASSPLSATPTNGAATTTQPSTIISGVPDETYVDSKLSFSITHPTTATTSPVDYSGYLPLTQTPLASFALPRSMFAGTNLDEAGVYIGASSSPEAITSCDSALPSSGETSLGTETINGADFAVFASSDAGAGNFYDSKIYRRIENGWCVEVIELLHSTNIANYTPGTVKEFDKTYYQTILDKIVHTYQSIPTGV